MSSVVAIVKSIVGQVFAVSPEGVRRLLVEGDRLFVGDQVDTGAAGAVTLELADGRTLDLGRDTQWSGIAPDSSADLAQATAQAAPSVEELQQAIVAGADPTTDLEATAAGPTAAGTGGAAGGGHSFVMLDATAGRVDPTIGFPTDGPDSTATATTLDIGNQNTTATNAPSVLTADTGTQAEDSVATGNVLTNDSDADTPLSVSSFTVAGMAGSFTAGQTATIVGVGTLTIGTNGNYTFTPDANYNGAVPQVTYTTNTGLTSTLDLTVTAVDDPSVLTADTQTIAEDTPAIGNVLSNDSDIDNVLSVSTFSIAGVNGTFTAGQTASIANVGTLVIAADGAYTFTPVANYNGTVPTVSYTVIDGSGSGVSSTLDIDVTPVDDSFIDVSETVTTSEDAPVSGSVLAGTSSVDGPVSVVNFTVGETTYAAGSTATIANVGTLVLAANGAYTFTPAANYNGTVPTVSYTVTDGSGSNVTSTLNINVTPVDDSFTDISETVTTSEDAPVTGSVLTGTSSVDGPVSVLNFTIGETTYAAGSTATLANVGTLVIGTNGAYTFTPATNYNGSVPTVSYTVTDGSGSNVTSTLNINVTPVDDSFTDISETVTTSEDAPVTGSVLTGTSSVDGDVSVVNFTVGGTQYQAGSTATIANVGTLVIGTNGAYTFTPAANYNGTVPTVSYTVTDGSGSDVTSTLNISVTPVDDSFTDISETVTTSEDAAVSGSVLTGTSSVDGDVSVVNFTVGGTQYQAGSTATLANVGTLVLGANGAYTFTPATNYNGTVPTVSYTVTDGSGSNVTSTLNISVTPVDDSFTDISETVTTSEDAPVTGSVLTGTNSVDGPVSVVNFTVGGTQYQAGDTATIANVGTLVIGTNGAYTFTPAANYNGTVPTVSYTVTDGSGSDVTSTLNISVTPVDDSFTDISETVTTSEDAAVSGSVLTGTSSVDGDVSVVNFTVGGTQYQAGSTATIANVGTLVLGANGAYTFTPAANYNGTVPTVSYTVTDGSGTDVTSTLNINVTPVDDSFTDISETVTTSEDAPVTGSVLTGTSSVDGPVSVLNFTIGETTYAAGSTATLANVGTLVIGTNGAYTFTPATNYNGSVPTVSYTVTDGSGSNVTSTLNINVTPVDDSFTDISETVTTSEDAPVTGSVLTGTSSVDGDVSVVNFTVGGTQYQAGSTATIANVGTLVLGANGAYTFTPAANYNGAVPTVSYTVTDGSGSDVTSTLNINVTPVDDSFTDISETVTTSEDAPVAGSVLTGTSSVDGDVSVVNFTVGGTQYQAGDTATITNVGTLVLAANGAYTFTPAANYNGPVPTVSYTVTDGSGTDVTSTLNINVTPVDDSFTDVSETVTTSEDAPVTGSVLTGTSSVDGPVSVLNFTVGGTQYQAGDTATIANVGTLVLAANGAYTFTPAANYNGTVPTVSYTVTDGSGTDVTSTLNINVTPVDDSFTDVSETVTTSEDAPVTGSVLTGTSSVDGDVSVVNFTVGGTQYQAGSTATLANVGTLVLAANGAYTFTPAANYNGTVPTVSYTVTDGSGTDVTSTLNINVTPVDDSFTDISETVTTSEDAPVSGSVLTGTSSVDGDVSVVNFTVGGTQYQAGDTATITNVGTLVLGANGAYTFTPAANYNGAVPTVSYTVTDGSGSDVTSTLNISVTPVDDSFTDISETVTTSEDAPVSGSVLTGTSSVDGDVSVVNFTVGGTQYQAGDTATITNVGTLVLAANGAYTFTPAANYNGAVPTVSYTVTDGSGSDVTSTLNISVTPVDDNFTDISETVTTSEDAPVTGSVLTGTSSVDGNVSVVNFTIGATTYAAGSTATIVNVGTLVLAANGAYTFTPAANYNGTVPTVSYTVTDGSGTDVTSTLNINVTPVDDSFTDISETVTTSEDAPVNGSVLTGTSSVDGDVSVVNFTVGGTQYQAGDTATITNVGTLVLGANGAYTFTPAANYNGTVPTVSYTVTDGSGTDVTSTLNINVTPVDDSFTDISETVTTSEDAPVNGSVLTGTSSVDGDVSVVNFTVGGTQYQAGSTATLANVGTLVIGTNGAYTFTPATNYNGTVPTVSYTVTDGSGSNVTSTLNISVTPVDDPSVLTADTNTVDEDHVATGNVLGNDSDVDNALSVATFTVQGVTGSFTAGQVATIAGVGTVTIAANGDYSFTPTANWNGTAPQISYITNTNSISTLDIKVNPVNDAPTVSTSSATGNEDQLIAVQLGGNDIDGTVGHFNLTSLPANGVFYADAAGTIALTTSSVISATANGATVYFKPTGDWSGTTQFTYTSTDNQGMPSASSATGTIVVAPITDTPSLSLTGGGTVVSTDFQEVALNNGHGDVNVSQLGNGVWHTDNRGGMVEIGKASVYGAGGDNQVIELERNAGDASNLYTTIDAKAGSTYNVSFDYAPRAGVVNSHINVYWGDQLIGTLNTTTTGMQHYSFDIPVTADGNQKLEFRAGDRNSLGGVLDNIDVTQVLNSGLEDQAILLSTIQAHTNDVDGSETLTLTLNGLPAGSRLTDGTHTFNAADGSTSVDITGWNLSTLKLTPPTNFNGDIPLTVTATAKDGDAPSASTSLPLVVHVGAVDDASVLQADKITVDEDHNATGNVLGNDSDVDNVLSVTSFNVTGVNGSFTAGQTATINGVGTLIIASNGDYTFKPAADWNGNVPQVTYTTSTGSSSTLNISVTPVNDNFSDVSEIVTVNEDSVATGSVLSGTSSVDGPVSVINFTVGATTYTAGSTATIANVGTLVIGASGAYTFTPTANYNGSVPSVSYTVTDGSGNNVTSTLNISVTPVNDNFTDISETVTTSEDAPVSGSVLNGTSSVDGPVSVLNFTVGGTQYAAGSTATIANVGTLVLAANGDYTFTPATDYNGSVPAVSYTVTDGSGSNVTSSLNISVTPVDDPSVLTTDINTVLEDKIATGNVLTNDRDVDNVLSVAKFTVGGTEYTAGATAIIANIGTLVLAANGAYTFTPASNWSGNVPTVTYTTSTGSSTTLDINVTAVADAPIVTATTTQVAENGSVALGLKVTSPDTDGSETQTITTIGGIPAGATLTDGTHTFTGTTGNAVVNLSGWDVSKLSFTPAPYATGTNTLTVTAVSTESQGDSASSSIQIPITINPAVYNAITGTAADDTVTGTGGNDIVVADIGGLTVIPGQNYNIAFMVDSSGSMSASSVTSAKNSLISVFTSLIASATSQNSSAGTVKVFLVDFDTQVNKSISIDLSKAGALDLLKGVLNSMQSGGYTNYEDVFKTTANWFKGPDALSNPNAINLTYFITDGEPTAYTQKEQTNPLVVDFKSDSVKDLNLDDVLKQGSYTPGTEFRMVIGGESRLVVDSFGALYKWSEKSNGNWTSEKYSANGYTLQVHAQGDGTYELSDYAGNGSVDSTSANNAATAFALFAAANSTVQAIGVNSAVSVNDLAPYNTTDGKPLANINPEDLANAILGHSEATLPGKDTINGGDGNDIIFGDLVSFTGVTGEGYTALQAFVGKETGIETNQVTSSNVHQYVTEHYSTFDVSGAHDGNDTLLGGAGNDIIFGQGGDDKLYGGSGNDILLGGTGNDLLNGEAGDDFLIGGTGTDTLDGGAGNDTLLGGTGNDTLIGGLGADTFVWKAGDTGTDVIKDFKASEGDRIDLRDLLQNESGSTIDNFLKITTVDGVSSLQVSSAGKFNGADAAAAQPDVTIKLEGNNWSSASINSLIASINSLIAGSDPTIKIDHSNS